MESHRAGHQAHQIDFENLAKALHLELAAAIDHGALRQHQHVERLEGWREFFDLPGIADIEPGIVEAFEMRAFVRRIVRRVRAGAANRDACALSAKRLCNAVADAAGAADHQNLPAAEIEFVHALTRPCLSLALLLL